MSAKLCPECGSSSVQQDAHFCQDQQVCTDCGFVMEEGSLHHDPADAFAPVRPTLSLPLKYRQHNSYHDFMSKTQRDGLRMVEEISAMLRITSQVMIDEGKSLFNRAYHLSGVKKTQREKKRALPGCCVYIVCRQHDWPVTVSVMWDLVQCRDAVFCSVFKVILAELNITITVPDIETVVPSVITKCEFNFELDESQIKMVIQIVCLAKNAWISSGRRYDPVIMAAVYLVWKAADYSKRKHARIPAFCRQMRCGPRDEDIVRSRVKELEGILLKLASEIPWVETGRVNRKNIVCYIPDIFKYEKTLLDGKNVFSDDSDLENGNEDGMSEGKFLPPSMLHSKATSDERDTEEVTCDVPVSHSTELGEMDIPDSEMHKYIRTTQEVRNLQEALEKAADIIETDRPPKRRKHKKKQPVFDFENTS